MVNELYFKKTQEIVQKPGEHYLELHERLRPQATSSIKEITESTQITTPSWYTFDVSKLLEIPNSVALCTSTCKHEIPYYIFVGKRDKDWQEEISTNPEKYRYTLTELGRELIEDERNLIYDKM